jgi:hypothetical protein
MIEKRSPFDYEIERITGKRANQLTIANHYLGRQASTMFAFGLFDGLELIGTIIYGKPASPSLCKGVCGPEESPQVIELTRLWIADGTPKNTESYLIGRTLKMLPKEHDIIVSYAEIGAGHVGTVYQATNWIYTGLSDRHVEWRLDGEIGQHTRHLFDEHGGVKLAKEVYGDRLQRHERGRKHRYIFFTGSKSRRAELKRKLRYAVQPYPKLLQFVAEKNT